MYTPTAPSVRQVFTEGYMSGETLINRPDIFEEVFPFLAEEKTIVDFMIVSGRKKNTIQSNYYWHEEDALIPVCQIDAVTGSGGAGNPVTITIEAINTDKEVPFKKWDIWRINGYNGWIEKTADITVSSGDGKHQAIFKPVDNTVDIVSAATVGDWVIWVGAAKADGTAQPPSMFSKPLPFSGQTQIVPTNYTTHGSAAANKAFIKTKSGNEFFYYRGVEQAVIRHKMAIVYTLLIGQSSTGLADSVHEDGSTAVRTTAGMDQVMRSEGNPLSDTAFDFDELQMKINKTLDEVFSPEEYFVLMGNRTKYDVDNIFFDRNFTDGSANYGAFATRDWQIGNDPKERAVSYNFASGKIGTRTFHFRQEKALYYPSITGATGMTFPDTQYYLPANTIRDAKTGEWMYAMCIRTKASDREERFTTEWTRDYRSDDIDKFRFNHRSELGWMQARLRQTVVWEKS
ncbi:hypothetical protein LCGC14_0503860 [marine sediment metagenome]|uniref:Uncharacterized protein n=1 Tax=marine sediment metagenome TaxID=412755 RepID=A0A0F9VBW2_9ZZZZ